VNIGFIQGVVPLIDFGKIDKTKAIHELSAANKIPRLKNIKKGIKIMLDCDYCHGVIAGAPQVFKFANYERFFCCVSCKSEYKRKYGGRIQTIIENYVK
jgi:Lrp/AsnC family leucine-responsive transcriptional regulator